METIDLGGAWTFRARDGYSLLPGEHRNVTRWMQADVPGTVHTDLIANGRIADPFYRTNEKDVQWVDTQQWQYRREVVLPAAFFEHDAIDLVAEGLDTFAQIRCNGKPVAGTANMFVAHRFDVRRLLKAGRNVIEVLFDSPTQRSKALERKYGRLQVALESHRVYARKAQYSFGWDWGPKLTTSGIWRSIRLEGYSSGRLEDPHITVLSLSAREAVVRVTGRVGRVSRGRLRIRAAILDGANSIERDAAVKNNTVSFRFVIKNPRRWWPNGYGDQPMYTALFTLSSTAGDVHSLQVPFALRTVHLLQKADAQGKSFVFEVNGTKVFCKGADWIPSDCFLPRIPASTYERLLTMARDASMNMIRVWGGGIYEEDIFYDLCDRMGLMVWQDFMYACGEYPDHRAFIAEAKREAVQVVKRIRNHPSIVLWCGNNECEWIYCAHNPGKTSDDMRGAKIFREVLPSVVRSTDPARPYWRSTPFGGGFPNAEDTGNHHQWEVWSLWKDFKEYAKNRARFVSEFGFQAPANRSTLEQVMLPSDRTPQSEVMEFHNKQVEGTERLFRFQAAHYQLGVEWDDFIYKGQLLQAEALKYAAEHWRQRKFRTAGALFWQLNDCWPVSSWSVVDSDLQPKAAYFYAKRFYAPVLVSFHKGTAGIEVWGTNDFLQPAMGRLVMRLRSFAGRTLWRQKKPVGLPANGSVLLMRVPLQITAKVDPTRWYLHAQLCSGRELVAENRFFFVEPKHLSLPAARIRFAVKPAVDGRYHLVLRSDTFAMGVRIEVREGELALYDNYVDLDPKASRTISFWSSLAADRVHRLICIKALNGQG